MRGVPLRLEIGPRDVENGTVVLVRRDNGEKLTVNIAELAQKVPEILQEIQDGLLAKALKHREEHTSKAYSLTEIKESLDKKPGFVKTMWCGDRACEDQVKEVARASSRCMPFENEHLSDTCAICGKPAKTMVIWGRAY